MTPFSALVIPDSVANSNYELALEEKSTDVSLTVTNVSQLARNASKLCEHRTVVSTNKSGTRDYAASDPLFRARPSKKH